MRANLLERLSKLKFEETDFGFKLVGYNETIKTLGMCARVKYKKKLKSKRLIKKYAKIFLADIIEDFINAHKEKSNSNNVSM